MSIELTLLRTVETLVQKRITRLERRVSYLHLSPALLKDIGLEGHNVQIAHIRELPAREPINLTCGGLGPLIARKRQA